MYCVYNHILKGKDFEKMARKGKASNSHLKVARVNVINVIDDAMRGANLNREIILKEI